MPEKNYAIGVDIGGTSIRIGMVDENLSIEGFLKLPQEEILKDSRDSSGELGMFLRQYLEKYAKGKKILGVAMGFPAAMNKDRSMIFNAPNIRGLNEIDLKTSIGKYLPFPLFLEKDVGLLFHYDLSQSGMENKGVLAAFYIGTGFGNVISIDGKLLTGKNGVACELGHIPTWGKKELCTCGNEGCIENYASGRALAALRQSLFPEVSMDRLFLEKGDAPELLKFVDGLSIPIATELNIIDPDAVILGGGVVSMAGFPKSFLEERIRFHCRKPEPAGSLRFYYSHNAGENGVIGGALYVREQLKLMDGGDQK